MKHDPSFFQEYATSNNNVQNMSSVPDERRKKRGLVAIGKAKTL